MFIMMMEWSDSLLSLVIFGSMIGMGLSATL
jgi:hypothetical protein